MNNSRIIKFLKGMEFAAIACVMLICAYVTIFSTDNSYRFIALGVAFGALIGGIIDIKILLPRRYKDKDERTLIVMLLSQLLAASLILILVFTVFAFTVYGAIDLMNFKIFALFALTILIINYVTEKIAYKIINNKL